MGYNLKQQYAKIHISLFSNLKINLTFTNLLYFLLFIYFFKVNDKLSKGIIKTRLQSTFQNKTF